MTDTNIGWDDAPEPVTVDLTGLDSADLKLKLQEVLSQSEAAALVQALRGSAEDYQRNIAILAATIRTLQTAGKLVVRIVT